MHLYRKCTLLFAFFIFLYSSLYCEAQSNINRGDKLIEFSSPQEYKGDVQAWDAKSGNNGYVFFASGEGLSVYDGVRWFSPQSYGNKPYDLRTLFFDKEANVLYSGGDNLFGLWKTDKYGQFVYQSIYVNKRVDKPKMFWRIGRLHHYIYFGAKEAIFRYDLKTAQLDSINANSGFHFMYIADKVYVQENETLFYLDDMKMVSMPYKFSDRITAIYRDSISDCLLLFREDKGIYKISKDGQLLELNRETNRLIGKSRVFSVTQADDGTYLLGTILDGLFQVDRNGNILRNINKNNGLPYVSVLSVTTDSYNNIWMGLEGGIAKMDNIPFESFLIDYRSDIGGVYGVYGDEDHLYIATNKGVFLRDSENRYSLIPDTEGQAWSITKFDDEIIACHDMGVFSIKGMHAQQIFSGEGVWSLTKIPSSSDHYIGSNYHGFSLYKKVNGKITYIGPLGDFKSETRITKFDKYDYLWVMVTNMGFYRFTLSKDFQIVNSKLYRLPDFSGLSLIFSIDNELIFYSGKRTYRYDSLKDDLVYDEYAQSIIKQCGDKISFFRQFGNLFWFVNKQGVGYLTRKHNQFTINSEIFSGSYDKQIPWVFQTISFLSDNMFAYGLQNSIGLYQYNSDINETVIKSPSFSSIEIFEGSDMKYGELDSKEINLSSTYNDLLIYLSGINRNKLIEYRLEGYSDNWLLVKLDESLKLPHLSVGKYTLQIRNYGQKDSSYLQIGINVNVPWFLSFYAIGVYMLLFVIIFVSIRFYYKMKAVRMFHLEKQKLEQEQERYEKERLENDIKERDKKLASFMMSELNKNNLLSDIRLSLEKLVEVRDNTKDLKGIILNIDKQLNNQENWKTFLKYFNNIYDGFLDKLMDQYPQLTLADLKLCSYLKLNLNTKEIASLLNISPASVDTARHRLRKKLNLDNKQSLGQFLASI